MADRLTVRRLRRAAGPMIVLAALTAACARPTGDFGRAEPSVIHDRVLPLIGTRTAAMRLEPVSAFNLTDDEIELRDRAWAFLRAPHVGDWWLDSLVEGERTRLLPVLRGEGGPPPEIAAQFPTFALPLLDPAYDPSRYYRFLRADPYRSSEARWTRVASDMDGDSALIPPYCAIAARVRRTDLERLAVLSRPTAVDPSIVDHAVARVAENEAVNSWVWRALRSRLASYRIAIDSLQIETPSDQLYETNRSFDLLASTRCRDAPPLRQANLRGTALRSRLARPPDPFDEPVLQK